MTGYEIYDEGYEAGYESAMADIMEALYGEDEDYDAANEDLFNFDDLDDYDDAMEAKNSPYRQYRKNRNLDLKYNQARCDYRDDHDTKKFSGRAEKISNRELEELDNYIDYNTRNKNRIHKHNKTYNTSALRAPGTNNGHSVPLHEHWVSKYKRGTRNSNS